LRSYNGLKSQDLEILWAIFGVFLENRWFLSNCR